MSRGTLGLSAFRTLARRETNQHDLDGAEPRPKGEVLWAHATSTARYSALCSLGLRLRALRPDLRMLISVARTHIDPKPEPLEGCDLIVSLDADSPAAARAFLAHWQPDICLWTGGDLMPALIEATSEAGVPLILLDISETEFPARRRSWLPDGLRSTLNRFDVILANSEEAMATLNRIGVFGPKLSVSARLRNSAAPPSCSDEELAEVTRDIAGRPVWLAAHLRAEEFGAVLAAHRTALRLVHRLLLIAVTDRASDADLLKEQMAEAGLRSIDWDTGDVIEENTQAVVSRDLDNLGLWYRVAPLSFLGRSLDADASGRSPLEAAALGSAVLYGPHVGTHVESYARLAAAGAARNVRDGESLGSAVIQLVAPDHAAAMALAGWEVVTEDAHLTDRLIDLILDFLDLREAQDARS